MLRPTPETYWEAVVRWQDLSLLTPSCCPRDRHVPRYPTIGQLLRDRISWRFNHGLHDRGCGCSIPRSSDVGSTSDSSIGEINAGITEMSNSTFAKSKSKPSPRSSESAVPVGGITGVTFWTGDEVGVGSSSSTSVPGPSHWNPTIRSIVISLVSMSIIDGPVSWRGLKPLISLALSTVLGLNALSGIDTGNTDGRQSITVSPTMSAGFWIVRSGPSSTASGIRRIGREDRCNRLADLHVGVAPRPVSGGDADSPSVRRGGGRRARSLSM